MNLIIVLPLLSQDMRTSLREVVLQIKAMGYSREEDSIRLIDSPDKKNWQIAKNQLRLLGALDPQNETKLSEFGYKLSELSCDPREGTMLLRGCEMGRQEMALIAAIRSVNGYFIDLKTRLNKLMQLTNNLRFQIYLTF